jgi:ABC-type multidrug transport system ATPase subunit
VMAIVIQCEALSKRYRGHQALDGVDLEVGAGEVVGLLGANGAGKTTLLRTLVGLVRPDGGRVRLFGRPVPDAPSLARVGVLFEDPGFYPSLDANTNLGVLLAPGPRVAQREIMERLADVGLDAKDPRPVRTYSRGMRQRLGLAIALARRPDLLILDEPTNGLDPAGVHWLSDLIVGLRNDGVTVLLASHLLTQVERVCDRVVLLRAGRLQANASLDTLGGLPRAIQVTVAPGDLAATMTALAAHAPEPSGPTTIRVTGLSGRDVNAALVAVGIIAEEIVAARPGLEEWLLEAVKEVPDGVAES